MKNIFKMMGVALLACSMMMVSCGKDEEEENNNNQNNNEQSNTPEATVTFGSNTWTVGASACTDQYLAQYGVMYERLYKVERQLPYVDLFHTPNPGNYSTEANIQTRYEGTDSAYTYVASYTDENIYNIEYGEQTQVQTGAQSYSGDWGLLSATMNITAYDANTMKATYNVTARMYDFYSWMYALVNNVEDADVENLTVNVKNYTFTAM